MSETIHGSFNAFDPDWTISPGETLREWMDPKQLQGILDGNRRITTVAACKLQQGTGIPARLWLNLERAFRQGLAEGKTWLK